MSTMPPEIDPREWVVPAAHAEAIRDAAQTRDWDQAIRALARSSTIKGANDGFRTGYLEGLRAGRLVGLGLGLIAGIGLMAGLHAAGWL